MKDKKSNSNIYKNPYIPTTEFYSQVIDSLEDYSIFTLDKELNINSWNTGARKLFQYETEDVIGKHFDIIFTEEDKKNEIPKLEIAKSLKEGKANDNRWHIRKDKSKFYAFGLVYQLKGDDGKMLGYVKILRDLTERKKSEKYAKEMEDNSIHRESMIGILSHDLRSPLAGIIGAAEYLKLNFDKKESVTVKEMLDLLHQTSKDGLKKLDYLLEWARIKYVSEAFSATDIDLFEYVKKVFDILNKNAFEKNVQLHNEIKKDISVFADGEMVISILQNLVSNAIMYSHSGGKIIVSAERKEDEIIIKIMDTGIGMNKEIMENIFTPQISSLLNISGGDKGSGIGLLLVKGFVEKNGGEIWVESKEGEGSSFYFTLPTSKFLDSGRKVG